MEEHVLNLSLELKRRGHDVTVLTTDHDKKRPLEDAPESVKGIRIIRFHPWFPLGDFAMFWPQVAIDVFSGGADIVHVHGYRHPHTDISLLAAKAKGIPCVLTSHAPFHGGRLARKARERATRLYDRTLGSFLPGSYDWIIAVSREDKSFFRKRTRRVSVIPNGITKKDFRKGDGDAFRKRFGIKTKHFLLSVGRLHPTKGHHRLKKVMDGLRGFDVSLVIVGPDDGCGASLRRSLKGAIFTGALPHEEIRDALAGSDIFLLPSDYEAFGIVILEAMAQGVPVISTDQGGPKDIIRPSFGRLIPPDDSRRWIDACREILIDSEKREMMGKSAAAEAKKYLWSSLADEVEKVYLRCIR